MPSVHYQDYKNRGAPMNYHPILISALLVWLMTPLVQSDIPTVCEKGWFGERCVFKCQCLESDICGRQGECPNSGRCNAGYFGPGCQYWDLVSTDRYLNNETYYSDGNDSSCNPNRTTTVETVSLEYTTPFMWIRLVVKDNRFLLNFSLELNSRQGCSNQRRFILDPRTVDITCDNNRALQNVTFMGLTVRYICSIMISPGRNVALRQAAAQSPVTAGKINSPSNAVDGNTNSAYENRSCSYTTGAQQPWWQLTFWRPKIVSNAVIFNRNVLTSRMDGFRLETFTADGNRTSIYIDSGASDLVYHIALPCPEPITSIKVTAGSSFLTLCEVQVFGDSVCPDGKYGLECEQSCSCRSGDMCSTVTGTCAPGCPSGTYGPSCSMACPALCYENGCTPRDGVCLSCYPGFMGAECQQPCEPGSYGHQCSMNCSHHCLDVCNNQNGVCKCDNNNTGASCADMECPPGLFGSHCANSCSEYCFMQECLAMTGECLKCHGFREGRYCEECPAGTYGNMCQKPCSEYCLNATCDRDTGSCPACVDGYSGFHCSLSATSVLSHYWLFALSVPALVVVFLVSMFFFGRKRRGSQNEEEAGN